MALLDFMRSALPSNPQEVDAFNTGANQYMNRRRLGLENQRLQREENFRKLQMNNVIPAAQFDTSQLGGQINTGLKNIPIQNPDTGAGNLDMDGGVSQGQDQITDYEESNQNNPPVANLDTSKTVIVPGDEKGSGSKDQIIKPEFGSPDLSVLFPQGTVQKDDASDEEKEALHVFGKPWKVMDKNGGKILVFNGVEYDIVDAFGDGSSFVLQDSYGHAVPPALQNAFTQGRAKGITNTEIVPEDATVETKTGAGAIRNTFVNNAVKAVDNDRFRNVQTEITVEQARLLGVDQGKALSLLAIESNFGGVDFTKGPAKGALQIEEPAYKDVKAFYAGKTPAGVDAAEWAKLKQAAAQLPKSFLQLTDNRDQITAGLLYFRLIGFKGVAPEFQGAAYNDGYSKFIGINSLKDVKKFAKNHDFKSVNTYNQAFLSLNGYLNKVGNYYYPASGNQPPVAKIGPASGTTASGTSTTTTGNTGGTANAAPSTIVTNQTTVDNTSRSMNIPPKNVTDTGAGKDGSVVTQNLKKPEDGAKRIQKLTDVPNRLGFEFQKAMENRNILSQTLQNMQRAGLTGINRPEYQKGIADMMVLDSMLYVMQSEDALMSFEMSGNPARLNSVMDAFTGGGALIQARNDGKFDFIRPDGTAIPGLEGLSAGQVKLNARTIFDQKYRQSIEAATAKKNEAIFESKLKQIEEARKINAQAQADMIKKLVETNTNMDMKVEDSGRLIISSKGGVPVAAFQKQLVEEETPDGDTIEIEKYISVPIDSFDFGVGNSYMAEIAKIGKGQ